MQGSFAVLHLPQQGTLRASSCYQSYVLTLPLLLPMLMQT
jgi:hypothetical protein